MLAPTHTIPLLNADLTQPEQFHKYPKAHYKRTSRKNVSRQLSRIQIRQARIRKLRKQLLPEPDEGYQDDDAHSLPYFIGKSQNHPVNIPQFVRSNRDDPAAKASTSLCRYSCSSILMRICRTLFQS